MKKSIYLLMFALMTAFFFACNSETNESETAETPEEASAMTSNLEKNGLKLTPVEDSPAYEDAHLQLTNVEEGQKMDIGEYAFEFEVSDYELGVQTADAATKGLANSAKGQHIHFIMDNGPYSAHYEPTATKELEEGHHVLLAFLARSYHESVKADNGYLITQFTAGSPEDEPIDLSAEHLFYSRPKGTYKGNDTKKLLLDFYLLNTEISPEGNKVRATINGTEFILDKWAPYTIEGLELGEVSIKLELIAPDGHPIEGPFNVVERTVTLAAADTE